MKNYTRSQEFSLLALRFIIAAIFINAGIAKMVFWSGVPEGMPPMPEMMITLTKFLSIVEPLGGVALIIGFLTRWAAAGLAIIMVGAAAMMGSSLSFFTGMQGSGLDYIVMLLAGSLVLASLPAGSWSVDAMRRK